MNMKVAKLILRITAGLMIVVGAGLAVYTYWDEIAAFCKGHCPCLRKKNDEMADYVD
jgi:hypothetical protein